VEFNMLPKTLPTADAFAMARRAGFEVIECPTTPDPAAAEEMLAASGNTVLPIHFGDEPGASAQPAVVGRSRSGRKKQGRDNIGLTGLFSNFATEPKSLPRFDKHNQALGPKGHNPSAHDK
jgi:hypothetical protein